MNELNKTKLLVPPIKCQGIKTKLIPEIKKNLEWSEKGKWVEPFVGSGVVLFNINPKRAIVGDVNCHIVDFYNQIKKGTITSQLVREFLEEQGKELSKKDGEYYYQVRERFNLKPNALDFIFLNRSCFNGVMRFNKKGFFNVPFGKKPLRFSKSYITKIVNQIKNIEQNIRVNDWSFLCSDWRELLKKCTKDDFVYLDPPYIGRHSDYYTQWGDMEAEELARTVKELPCHFMFSMWYKNKYRVNEHVDKFFKDYKIVKIKHFYHVGATESLRNEMEEVLIIG